MKTIDTTIIRKSFDDKFIIDLYYRTNNIAQTASILKHLNPNNKIEDLFYYISDIISKTNKV